MNLPETRESGEASAIGLLEAELLAELDRYDPREQAAILKRMVNRLKKGRYVRSPIALVKEMVRTPLVWYLLSLGIVIPILFYILFVWISLAVEG
ncbi:hypothetical protein [Paenibacillus sp. HGF5]|uniref:hypothetical protein n=1 Tax=Paenibacillus sp. HGF5 TaxID=908341 RepID=UPI0020C7915B|nr:hypothetical protein [Paenibacillus sp. HGF5]